MADNDNDTAAMPTVPWYVRLLDPTGGLIVDAATAPSSAVEQSVADAAKAWAALEAQMASNPQLAGKIHLEYAHWLTFYANWQAGRKNIADVNPVVEDVNVARRIVGSFSQSNDPAPVGGFDIETGSPLLQAGGKIEDYCRTHPGSVPCTLTQPDPEKSWCQRAGMPASVCDKDGIRAWVYWLAGGIGVTAVGAITYAVYRGAPTAIRLGTAIYAPELLPLLAPTVAGASAPLVPATSDAVNQRLATIFRADVATADLHREEMPVPWQRGRSP